MNNNPTLHIAVVEDDSLVAASLQDMLVEEGYAVHLCSTGAALRALLKRVELDLILLDLALPDANGLTLATQVRATTSVPIIMLTGRGSEVDRIVGLEIGADDYVVKPFSVRELLLRVGAVLRRKETASSDFVEFGELRIDPAAHRAWVADIEIALTTLEFKLLLTLYERKNRVQTRSVLLNDIWGIEADITTRTVDTHVKRLREKLKSVGRYIETVRGVGYRFTESPTDEGV